jgi:threonylcarbamoyladenosine tRNA methylthiotransferase MtaB
MKKKIAFKTLGCRLNQFETDSLVSQFCKSGYEIVQFTENADVYIVNTCTVTNQSDKKSQTMINHARRQTNPLVVVTGCMANHFKEKLENENSITYVVPNEQKSSILSLVDAHYKGEIISPSLPHEIFNYEVAEKSFHTRCTVKIQDGCDNFCTFCIIPQVRGRAVSRPLNDIIGNINTALSLGYREIVLSGVNIGRYHFESYHFESLIEKILNIDGHFRLRISSLEPDGFGSGFLDLLNHPKMCPHLHLCLQSGSNNVLLRMRRMYTVSKFCNIVEKIKSQNPSFNFTTDVIVGFPGETDNDFEETCKIANDIAFSHIHTFKYSIRNNTRAARMVGQIPEKIKNLRSLILRQIACKNRLFYLNSFIGKEQTVLTEKVNSGLAKGYGENYIPIEFKGKNLHKNEFYKVALTEVSEDKYPILKGIVL